MANDEDLDLSGGEGDDAEAPSGGGKGKLIIIIAAVLLLGGGGAAYFMMGGDDADTAESTSVEGESADTEKSDEAVGEAKQPAIYVSVPNGILAQLPSGKKMTTLQIQVDMMVRTPEAAEALTKHMPLIENDLLLYFSAADAKELKTVEGKDNLRQGALKIVQKIMQEKTGKPGVEKVLFSGFVMQR